MTEWRTVPIGTVISEFHDGPHATPKPADEGPVYLGIKNLSESGRLDLSEIRHIAEDDFAKWTRRVTPRANDIVFTYEATLHRYALIPPDFRGCLGRRLALVRPDPTQVDPRFLHLAMIGPEWRDQAEAKTIRGSTVDRLPIIGFPTDFNIRLADLGEQRRIADVLSAFDDLIENNRRRIEILEETARSLYREWFVRYRFPGHESVELVDSPLGPIPAGWRVTNLGEQIEFHYGRALKKNDRRGGDIAVVGSSGIVGWHDTALAHGPGVVVGRKGHVGSVTWVQEPFYPIDTTYFVVSARPMTWVRYLLESLTFQNSHAAVPGLNRDDALRIDVVTPTATLIERFAEKIDPMLTLSHALWVVASRLDAARDLLLPGLVTGQIEVGSLGVDDVFGWAEMAEAASSD